MSSVALDTIGGFNRFVADQKKVEGGASLTLHQFDDQFETLMNGEDIQRARDLTETTFVPRGSTALLDAIGRAIESTGQRLEKAPESSRAGKVVFVVITDGHENASSKFDRSKVFEMIKHQREKYSWEFVFLGANQDAIDVGAAIGISAVNAMTYAANAVGTDKAFAKFSGKVAMYRSIKGQSADLHWNKEDREEQKEAGA